MSEKKHIDRIFQEKLKDFEDTPDNAVWKRIKKELNQDKDDRKVIPLWWKFGGAAAALIILLTVGNLVFNRTNNPTNVVNSKIEEPESNQINETDNVVVNGDAETFDLNDSKSTDGPSLPNKQGIQTNNTNQTNSLVNSNESDSNTNQRTPQSDSKRKSSQKITNTNNNLAINRSQSSNNIITEQSQPEAQKTALEAEPIKPLVIEEGVVENKPEDSEEIDTNISGGIVNAQKEEQLAIEEEKEKIPLTDAVIADNKEVIEDENKLTNRWQINPNVAPVYFNSFGEGSPIHEQLVNNNKSGTVNMSYGVNVSYEINDKLSVKSGVNRVNLGYNTNDVIIYENIGVSSENSDLFRNIKLNTGIQSLSFVSGNNLGFAQSPSIIPNESMAYLSQEMTYFEIPLELKYKLTGDKVGFSVVGGFSTFILNDNQVTYELRGVNTELGEATNLNELSYSANFGFGLDFLVTKNINLNLDPMFKYQINTFNSTSGDFKPYIIGVYSGINIKF